MGGQRITECVPSCKRSSFCHFALFVTAVWLLTNDVITDNDAEIATTLIQSYQRLIPTLYGESEQTYTKSCHALLHLPEQVMNHGPLILHSSFEFEAMISYFKRQLISTRENVAHIVRNLLTSGSFINKQTKEPTEVKSFIEDNIMDKKGRHLHKVGNTCHFILSFKSNPNLPDETVHCLNLENQ